MLETLAKGAVEGYRDTQEGYRDTQGGRGAGAAAQESAALIWALHAIPGTHQTDSQLLAQPLAFVKLRPGPVPGPPIAPCG